MNDRAGNGVVKDAEVRIHENEVYFGPNASEQTNVVLDVVRVILHQRLLSIPDRFNNYNDDMKTVELPRDIRACIDNCRKMLIF